MRTALLLALLLSSCSVKMQDMSSAEIPYMYLGQVSMMVHEHRLGQASHFRVYIKGRYVGGYYVSPTLCGYTAVGSDHVVGESCEVVQEQISGIMEPASSGASAERKRSET